MSTPLPLSSALSVPILSPSSVDQSLLANAPGPSNLLVSIPDSASIARRRINGKFSELKEVILSWLSRKRAPSPDHPQPSKSMTTRNQAMVTKGMRQLGSLKDEMIPGLVSAAVREARQEAIDALVEARLEARVQECLAAMDEAHIEAIVRARLAERDEYQVQERVNKRLDEIFGGQVPEHVVRDHAPEPIESVAPSPTRSAETPSATSTLHPQESTSGMRESLSTSDAEAGPSGSAGSSAKTRAADPTPANPEKVANALDSERATPLQDTIRVLIINLLLDMSQGKPMDAQNSIISDPKYFLAFKRELNVYGLGFRIAPEKRGGEGVEAMIWRREVDENDVLQPVELFDEGDHFVNLSKQYWKSAARA
ncbi:uncharacterized protein BXZ73DRAFT_101763 [Epithele typhae]|uniref:uncharacterized protein n=1 Tax=Epithele typhae TaxID=378194 RepID=UPI0020086CA4|nr:uncharacterized protein BXZ73DRAFT_101763 [Epithele typhae]KAH9931182.1 hypothetical protein BXZ73DRAFT_101763 [Epithele typhae]